MIEVEVKYKISCDEIEALEKKLEKLGFKLVKSGVEKDTYFNSPFRDFRKSDEALRVRESDECYLTYKGKKIDKKTKTREELNVRIENAEVVKEILLKLGFYPVKEVIKFRRIYEKNNIFVCLDKVNEIGCFVEVEMDVENKENVGKAIKKIESLIADLGIKGESITESYLEMLLKKVTGNR